MRLFFYGLFMDKSLLETKGVYPSELSTGFVEGLSLRIGERATLLHNERSRAYGVVMSLAPREAEALYSEASVADYLPETVTVDLVNGGREEAVCYNLPQNKISGANSAYAQSLLELAIKLDFPASYLDEIRAACNS